MAIEVGRITARIEAQVADFEQKMAGAQKTFESVSVKMEASATRATATIQKSLKDRILAANGAAAIEIEAARRTMRERLKFASSTAEISAVKKAYQDRANAARAGAAQEIAALKSVSGATGIVPVLDQISKSTGRATPGLNSVRSALTALTASALQTAPGVAQVSSVLATMAVGTTATIGILAGIAAITFAFLKMTEGQRELKKALEESDKALAALGQTQASQLALQQIAQDERLQQIDEEIGQLQRIAQARDPNELEQKKYNALLAERALRLRNIAKIETAITAFHKDELDRRTKDQQTELDKQQRAFEKYAEALARQWERLQLKLTPFEIRQRTRLQGAGAIDISAGGPGNNASRLLRDDIKQAIIAGMGAAARGAGGTGPGDSPAKDKSLRDLIKGKLNFTTIASGLVTGGISTAIHAGLGALTSFADRLFDFSGKAKAAAAAMKKAQEEWSKNLDRFILENSGTDAQKSMADALDQVDDFIAGFEEVFNKGQKLKRPDFQSLDEALAFAQSLLESSFSVDPARAAEWQKIIDAIRILQGELGKTADAANDTVASLTNVPNGFKIALARFNATMGSPALPPFIPSGPRGGFDPTATGMNARAATTVINAQVIEVYGAKDVKAFLRELEVEIKRQELTGGTGITMGY